MAFTMERARALVDAGIEAAQERGYLVCVVVVDHNGQIMWLGKMDGTKFLAPDIARAKAYTSAAFRQSSALLEGKANPKTLFYVGVSLVDPGHIAIGQGALPIWDGDDLVGAIGVSGAAPQEDEDVAQAALDALDYKTPNADVAGRAAAGHSR